MHNSGRINGLSAAERPHPRLIALASGKGGVGKSVIAYNLADRLSRGSRVLLIDADFTMGNLHLLANAAPTCGWQSICNGENEFGDAIIPLKDGLDLLASVIGRADQMLPELPNLTEFLTGLRESADYDIVIFDTASGLLPHSNLILNAVDEIILVTTPELTALSDSYALYKILVSNKKHVTASLLINRESRQEDIEYICQKFLAITNQFLGRSPGFLGALSDDPAVVESVACQRALSDLIPAGEIVRQFIRLAENFAGSEEAGQSLETTNLNPAGADIRE